MIADDRGRFGVDDAAIGVDHDKGAVYTDGGEHGGEKGGFVFAVAIAVVKNVACEVGLIAADAHLDGEVADLFLDKFGDGFGLVVEVGLAGSEFGCFRGDFWRRDETVLRDALVPLADALPGAFCGRGDAGAAVVNSHATFERVDRGAETDILEVDGGSIVHDPPPVLVFEVDGRGLLSVSPNSAVGEARREFEGEGLVEVGNVVLEEPCLLGEVGMGALLVLVGDDAAWIPAGSFGDANFVVFEEIPDAVAVFGHLVVLDGILVAVGADAPDVHGENFGVLIEGDRDDGLSPALGAEDLDDMAVVLDGAAVRGDGVSSVVEEDDCVGLVGVLGEFLLGGGANPLGD